jgi:proteasome accessory factor B
LEQYQGTPFHRQLEIAFEKLTGGLKDRISFSPADELRAVSFKNIGFGKADDAVFGILSSAVLKQQEVEFDYRKPGETKPTRRRVHPYHLSHRENLWYLVAKDVERTGLRTFALPRIKQVRLTSATFARPEDFSPESFFSTALGVMGGTGNYLVRVRFDRQVADRVRERVWHDSQKFHDLSDGRLEVTMRLGALGEVETWILGWGARVEVLEPLELRQSVMAVALKMAKLYA